MTDDSRSLLRMLPSVSQLLDHARLAPLIERHGRGVARDWARRAIEEARANLLRNPPQARGDEAGLVALLAASVERQAASFLDSGMNKVINATGVVLHTGLGRAPLSRAARAALAECAGNCNLELDLQSGERQSRGERVARQLNMLTGAESSLVVNNNAAATVLVLDALCRGREVLLSRGQLVEIGGSFRLPEIFAQSGALLREVGTTNRTWLADYQRAIGPNTAAILHVHASNFRVVGYAGTPRVAELARLARAHRLLCIDDLGSGCLIDTARLGLPAEPTFSQSLSAGSDLVLGSGDKLLGGPQSGIILGQSALVDRLRKHPLARAFRVGKLTLAALAATLDSYMRQAHEREIPIWRLLAAPLAELRRRAAGLRDAVQAALRGAATACPGKPLLEFEIAEDQAAVGGGSLPEALLPTCVICVRHHDLAAASLARRLRLGSPRVVPRIRDGRVLIDLRSVCEEDDSGLRQALLRLAEHPGGRSAEPGS